MAPNLTFILDIPPEVGLERARRRRGEGEADRFEAEDLAFHAQLRDKFLEIAASEPQRCRVIDATLPPEIVADAIWTTVCEKFLKAFTDGKKWA